MENTTSNSSDLKELSSSKRWIMKERTNSISNEFQLLAKQLKLQIPATTYTMTFVGTDFDMQASDEMFAFIKKIHQVPDVTVFIDLSKMNMPELSVIAEQLKLAKQFSDGKLYRTSIFMPQRDLNTAFKIRLKLSPPKIPIKVFRTIGHASEYALFGYKISEIKTLEKDAAKETEKLEKKAAKLSKKSTK